MSGTDKQGAVVRVGPAGWSYEDWKGIVYPPGMRTALHPLTFLSDFFDTVEVNSSFYRPPQAQYCRAWIGKVVQRPTFKFTLKLWKRLTHERETWPGQDELSAFCEGIKPLVDEGKLGALLVQFPWSFKRTAENRKWLSQVLDTFADYPLALEIRHASWNCPEVYEGLAERRVAFCNIDQPVFPDSMKPSAAVTARVGYVRLHGRNYDDWFREDADRDDRYNYLYSEEELKPWIEKVEAIRLKTDEVYVITNNHYRGQAVVNAFELQAGLGQTQFTLPPHLVELYPRLKRLIPD